MPAPQYVIRSYGGGADVAQLAQNMGPSDTSFAIAPTTGWLEDDGSPLGTVGPFTVVVDRFTASVEKILCSAINLTSGVVTVYVDSEDGWSGRGYDGTAPQAHVPGGSTSGVQTCWSSAEAKEANQAVSKAEAIRKFRILPVDFTEDTGELTPTLKVKRKVVAEKFASDIEALYQKD